MHIHSFIHNNNGVRSSKNQPEEEELEEFLLVVRRSIK